MRYFLKHQRHLYYQIISMAKNLVFLLLLSLVACVSTPVSQTHFLTTGDALFDQGDVTGALLAFEQFQASSPREASELALRQSRAYLELGKVKLAQEAAQNAATEAAQTNDAKLQILANIQLGLVEISDGRLSDAQEILLATQQQIGQQPLWAELAQIQLGLAALDKLAVHNQPMLAHYQKAQEFASQSKDALLEANILLTRLQLLAEQDKSTARLLWSRALAKVQALPDSARRNFALVSLAKVAQTEGLFAKNDDRSIVLLQEVEKSSLKHNDERLLSYALGYQGSWYEQTGDYTKAAQLTANAADAAQRANALESLYLWEWQSGRLHQKQGQDDAALAAYQRAVFNLQQIRQSLGYGQSFRQRVSPLYLALADLQLKKAHKETDSRRVQELLTNVRNTQEQLKSAELQDYFQDRCIANFKEKKQGLDKMLVRTAVLYPILLKDRTEIIVGFDDGLKQFIVPVGSDKVNAQIREFRRKLEKRSNFKYRVAGQQLYQWLIAPLLPELQAHHIDTLVIVPEGALRTIPFSALYDGKHYVIEHYAIATIPGLSLTDPKMFPHEPLEVLIAGLTQSVQGFAALPNVGKEIKNINSQIGGTQLIDHEFLLSNIGESMAKNPYQIVHIATHGQFDSDPKKTFLLTYDGKMTMDLLERYMEAGKYRKKPVELLILSACKTAAGDERAALGMAGVAIKAGVRSALASLWFINDQSSSELVTLFHENLKKNLTKAKALQSAQQALLKDERYQHAAYWAPFLLIGNWL